EQLVLQVIGHRAKLQRKNFRNAGIIVCDQKSLALHKVLLGCTRRFVVILVASRCGEEGAKADRCRLPALPSTPREAERCAARRSRRGRGITAAWNQNRPAALGKTRGLDPEKAPKMRRPSASAPGGLPLAGGLSRLVFGPFRLSRRSPSPREVCMTRNALIL